jgi:hypothetical protein
LGIPNSELKLSQLRWHEITETLETYDRKALTTGDKLILEDLIEYLKHKNLVSFSKFSFIEKPFDKKPDAFYGSTKFKGFTFQDKDFGIQGKPMFYKGSLK